MQIIAVAFAGACLLLGLAAATAAPIHVAARQAATPAANPASLYVLATSESTLPAAASDYVWQVQQGAVSGDERAGADEFAVGFVLARRGALDVQDGSGTSLAALSPGQAAPLPAGGGAMSSVSGDLALYALIALVPAADLPALAPPRSVATPTFSVASNGPVTVELVRGFLNPGRAALVPAPDFPIFLLATDNSLRVESAAGQSFSLARDEIALLAGAAIIHNDGPQPATVVAAVIGAGAADAAGAATPRPSVPAAAPLDPVVDEAWRRYSCHVNPGNAACAIVGVAATCATHPDGQDCRRDGDGDGCTDVLEVRAGFDPFAAHDCISGGQGAPAVNCLFLTEDVACAARREAAGSGDVCAAVRNIRLRRDPTSMHGCGVAPSP